MPTTFFCASAKTPMGRVWNIFVELRRSLPDEQISKTMPHRLTHDTLESVIVKLADSCAWVESLGLRIGRTRFVEYLRILREVSAHRFPGKIDQLSTKIGQIQYQDAYIESTYLIDIWNVFRRCRGSHFLEILMRSLGGNANPRTDKTLTSSSQDTLFELSLAATFRSFGIPVLVGRQTDILARFRGQQLYCKCKRPRKPTSFERNIKDAASQLRNRIQLSNRSTKPHAIIALDVSFLLNPDRNVILGRDFDSIINQINLLMKRFNTDHGAQINQRVGRRILCVVSSFRCLTYFPTENRHMSCHKIAMHICQLPGTSEFELARKLLLALTPQ
jgi:hypothetical protein